MDLRWDFLQHLSSWIGVLCTLLGQYHPRVNWKFELPEASGHQSNWNILHARTSDECDVASKFARHLNLNPKP